MVKDACCHPHRCWQLTVDSTETTGRSTLWLAIVGLGRHYAIKNFPVSHYFHSIFTPYFLLLPQNYPIIAKLIISSYFSLFSIVSLSNLSLQPIFIVVFSKLPLFSNLHIYYLSL